MPITPSLWSTRPDWKINAKALLLLNFSTRTCGSNRCSLYYLNRRREKVVVVCNSESGGKGEPTFSYLLHDQGNRHWQMPANFSLDRSKHSFFISGLNLLRKSWRKNRSERRGAEHIAHVAIITKVFYILIMYIFCAEKKSLFYLSFI